MKTDRLFRFIFDLLHPATSADHMWVSSLIPSHGVLWSLYTHVREEGI